MDIKSAFLNGFINEEVYVAQPPGFIDFKKLDHVYKLKKALYGLKQALKAWYDRLKAFLIKHEYKIRMVDNTLFTKKKSSNLIIVQIYVDDIIFGLTYQDMCDEFSKIMHDEFEMSIMGELNFFLRLQIKQMEDVMEEYLVKVNKRHVFWSLNEDILKTYDLEDQYAISIKKIRRIRARTHQKTMKETSSIRCIQNKTIRRIEDIVCEDSGRYQSWLEEEKARRRAIVFDDAFTSEVTPSYEPTVSPLNDNEIDFRMSFDESDEEDYTVVFDKNSFSYKIISTNDLKTDSESDNEEVNMPSFSSPEPTISYFSTEPFVFPQHIDEFNLKDETSLSECNEEEQNVLYFNDLFSFNVIYPDDLKLDTGNDNDTIDIEQPSRDMSVKPLPDLIKTDVGAYAHESNKLLETSHDTSNKFFKTETLIKELNVNIMALIEEYLVKVNKRRAFWSLNQDILKTYDSEDQYAVSIKKIRRIRA
ncbi:retrovirus-related pol polyprotein from transposon TNT 1-94 [Tanacetum coccineum]